MYYRHWRLPLRGCITGTLRRGEKSEKPARQRAKGSRRTKRKDGKDYESTT
jgi:hypothetical protein